MELVDSTPYRIGDTERAIAAFQAELGSDAVVTDAEDLKSTRDPFTYVESEQFDPSAMVMPETVEQVQAIVRIANETGTPLWTWSQGRNVTYGGPASRVRGSVVVNLRKMNRVLEVNEDLCYAVVEPGVRWFDLYDALEAAGGRTWTSIPDLGWGSVIANATEYGRGYTPMGDHGENLVGMEVVLPNGELMRTGFGALPGSTSTYAYKHGFGPRLDGLFYQSGNGIIVNSGFWLQRRPEKYAVIWLSFSGDDAFVQVADTMREMLLEKAIHNYPVIMRGTALDSEGNTTFTTDQDAWLTRFAVYGREDVVDAHLRLLHEQFGRVPGLEFAREVVYDGTKREDFPSHDDRVMAGIPDLDILAMFEAVYGPPGAHLDFAPTGRLVGTEMLKAAKLIQAHYEQIDTPFFSGLMISPRSVLHVSSAFYDVKDEAQTRKVYENYTKMVDIMAENGQQVYRTHLQHQDHVQSKLSFNDHIQRRVAEAIKDTLDPNGILQPGKAGIWARRFREDRGETY